jgi:hypothetical protein
VGCLFVRGKVDMVALAFEETLFLNGWQKAVGRAVKEILWRCNWLVAQIYRDRMPLVSSNKRAVGAEGEARFVIIDNHLL